MISDRYIVAGGFVLISAVIIFSWAIAFGPLYEILAFPGELQPIREETITAADCVNHVFYVNGKIVPMSDGVIVRECGGR